MGIIELILGVLLILLVVNLILKFVPIPNSVGGIILAIIVVYLLYRFLA